MSEENPMFHTAPVQTSKRSASTQWATNPRLLGATHPLHDK